MRKKETGRSGSRSFFFYESQMGCYLKWKSSSLMTETCQLKCENFWLFVFCGVSQFWLFSSFVLLPFLSLICRMGVDSHPVIRPWFSVSWLRLRMYHHWFSGFRSGLVLAVVVFPFVVAAWLRQLVPFPWPCIPRR